MTVHRDDLRALLHLLALAPLYTPWLASPWGMTLWALLGISALALWPRSDNLMALARRWPDPGIISFPLSIALAVGLALWTDARFDLGEGGIVTVARASLLPLAVADPLHSWVGRRRPKARPDAKSPFGLAFSAPILLLCALTWATLTSGHLVGGLVFGLFLAMPLVLAAWVETWWTWGPDNPVLVLVTWAGLLGIAHVLYPV